MSDINSNNAIIRNNTNIHLFFTKFYCFLSKLKTTFAFYIVSRLKSSTVNKMADNAVKSVTRSNVTIPTHIQKYLLVNFLVFDGHSTMFVLVSNNQDVLMWSVNGTFNGQLQLLFDNSPNINSLAVDSANHTMYVGLSTGAGTIVSVFTLTYGSS
jgi:hypothetical protein